MLLVISWFFNSSFCVCRNLWVGILERIGILELRFIVNSCHFSSFLLWIAFLKRIGIFELWPIGSTNVSCHFSSILCIKYSIYQSWKFVDSSVLKRIGIFELWSIVDQRMFLVISWFSSSLWKFVNLKAVFSRELKYSSSDTLWVVLINECFLSFRGFPVMSIDCGSIDRAKFVDNYILGRIEILELCFIGNVSCHFVVFQVSSLCMSIVEICG